MYYKISKLFKHLCTHSASCFFRIIINYATLISKNIKHIIFMFVPFSLYSFVLTFFFWLSHVQISLCIFSSATQIWLLSQIQMEALYLMFCQNCPRNSKVEISLGFGKDAFTTVSTLFRLL